MKYSLRSLMIGITLFCVVLGGRIEYQRRWAVFHESESIRIRRDGPLALAVAHEWQAGRYRRAMLQPWISVTLYLDDSP